MKVVLQVIVDVVVVVIVVSGLVSKLDRERGLAVRRALICQCLVAKVYY